MDIHHIIAVGRATSDAQKLETKKKVAFTKFTLAVNEYDAKDKKAFFYDVLIFGGSSETALEKIKKGDTLLVTGKPDVSAYLSKDKQPKPSVTVLADTWKLLK